MKKVFLLGLVGIFIFGLVSTQVFSQTVDDILKKMIDAQGGRKKLESVKDSTTSGTLLTIQNNMNAPITVCWKSPNKSRVDIDIKAMNVKIIQATDGNVAWMDHPQTGLADMPEERAKGFKRRALGDGILLNPKKYGVTYTLKGKEKVKDSDCFVIERSFSDGPSSTLYVDSSTYLVIKSKSKSPGQTGQEVEVEVFYSDYKNVEGIVVPHTSKVFRDGQESVKLSFDKITFNSGLKDSFFVKPEAKEQKQ